MRIKEDRVVDYKNFLEVNSHDGYSMGVVNYMRRWAEMMEEMIDNGAGVAEAAAATEHAADTEGITGFMYGCAVQALSEFWEYGEILRVWHNRRYGHSGSGTVNPAILTVG